MKKILTFVLAMAMVASLAACGGSKPAEQPAPAAPAETEAPAAEEGGEDVAPADDMADLEEVTLVYADGAAKGAVGNLWAEAFIKHVGELTGGKISIDYYSNSELGGDTDIITQMQAGTIDMCNMQSMNVVSFIPELGVFELPLVFAKYDAETIDKVVKPGSEFYNTLNAGFNKAGFQLIDYLQGGTYREMSSNKEVHSLADFAGIKIRTLTSEYQVSFWENLGCSPTPLAFTELYTSLQQGVVEAEENAIDTQVNAQFYEVQKYLIMTHHVLYGNLFYMTSEKFNALPEAYQNAIVEASMMASDDLQPQLQSINDESKQTMIDNGVEVIELEDNLIDEMIAATTDTAAKVRANIGDEICDLLINILEEAAK